MSESSKKSKYYAVARGYTTGVFDNWDIVNTYINGFSGAAYKGFSTKLQAEEYLTEYNKNKDHMSSISENNNSKIELLTNEQKTVLDYILEGHNVFVTGGGGVGKSFLISVIYNELPALKRKYQQMNAPQGSFPKFPRVQLCAMTGCAALLLGNKAKTLHSWAGIGLGKGTTGELFVKIRKNRKAMRNWLCIDLLVIDEISMLTNELLDKLDELAKKIRANTSPFGGIQLVLVGDFHQLPPVNRGGQTAPFAFKSSCWGSLINKTVELTLIQRQKDEVFQKILNEARVGELSKESCKILKKCQGRNWQENKIKPTLIFPRRAEVDMINSANIKAITSPIHVFEPDIIFDGKAPIGFDKNDDNFKKYLDYFDSDAPYLKQLELAVDTQVMLIANIEPDSGLVNGSRGIVSHFCPSTGLPYVEFLNGIKRLVGTHTWELEDYPFVLRTQVPLRLAYACTTHRTQGASLDSALVDIGSGNFEYGQAYVALSRVRSLEGLYVYDFDPVAFRCHPSVKEFYSSIKKEEILNDNHLVDAVVEELNKEKLESNDIKTIVPVDISTRGGVNVLKFE